MKAASCICSLLPTLKGSRELEQLAALVPSTPYARAVPEPPPLSLTLPVELLSELERRVTERVLAEIRHGEASSPWLSLAEAADYLRWPKARLYKLTAAHAIPHRKHEGRLLFRRDELDVWIDGYRQGPTHR